MDLEEATPIVESKPFEETSSVKSGRMIIESETRFKTQNVKVVIEKVFCPISCIFTSDVHITFGSSCL